MILTKIEPGDIDPDDSMSGIQYGDGGGWNTASDGGSVKSTMTGRTIDGGMSGRRRRARAGRRTGACGGGTRCSLSAAATADEAADVAE